jgi:hypothetical protein
MKIFRYKTAPLVAVFLSLFIAGCYTTLRPPNPATETDSSDNTNSYDNKIDWHFGYAWYQSDLSYRSGYLHYYYIPWWQDASQREVIVSDSTTSTPTQSNDGKITRRDYQEPYVGPFIYTPPANNQDTVAKHETTPDTVTSPIIVTPQPTNSTAKKPDGKIERRRGR